MMYTRFKISSPNGNRSAPAYTKKEQRLKTKERQLYRAPYPEHTRIITDSGTGLQKKEAASEINYIFDLSENTAEAAENYSSPVFTHVICALFSILLGSALIYLSGVSAPDYVNRGFMAAYNAVTEKYAEVFADAAEYGEYREPQAENASGFTSLPLVENENNGHTQSTETVRENQVIHSGETENSYIASLAGASEADALPQTVEASADEPHTGSADAVTVSKNLSVGSDKIYTLDETGRGYDLDVLAAASYPIEVLAHENELPRVLIVHTHGTEAYADSTKDGTTRTTDTEKNVVRIGRELCSLLNSYGIPTLHSETMHDEISYITSYSSSKKEVQKLLEKHPTIKYVIDLHRDALPNDGQNRVKTLAEINGEGTAQVMLVMGTNAGGGNHPDFTKNLTVAAYLQQKMNQTYPGLARPVNIRSAIFNQNVCSGSILLEVGSDANTVDEALAAVRMFARCFAAVV